MIRHNSNPKGSEWSKWDLHFHTPSSYDYKDNSVTNQNIIDILIRNEVRTVAVTDHHFIDVVRIKTLQELGAGKITILPGIEFLADLRGSDPIHFIGIFSEESDIEYIWGQIENCTEIKKIKGEGKKHNEIYCDLLDTISLVKKLGGIVSIHAGQKTNTVENITHSLPHGAAQKTDIAHNVDIYELGQESDQEGYSKIVFPTIGKIIPMVICSDNHNINNYVIKQNLWIKATPTFEGLKQIIYEPTDRIAIQLNKPDTKTPYLVIDKVRFNDKSDKFLFSTDWIELNDGLNVIIGGKSSGKSLLLYHIAKAIDERQVRDRANEGYGDITTQFDFEVCWKDNHIDSTTNPEKQGQITFVPQLYINNLAERNGIDQLYNLIQSITLQNENYKSFFDDQMQEKESNKLKIQNCINQIFALRNQYLEIDAQIKKIGTLEQIVGEIARLKKIIDDLRKQSGFTAAEDAEYEKLTSGQIEHKKKLDELKVNSDALSTFKKNIAEKNKITLHAINKDYRDFAEKSTQPVIQLIKDELEQNIEKAFKLFFDKANSEFNVLTTNIDSCTNSIKEFDSKLAPFQTKIKNQELLRANSDELSKQEQKKKDLEQKEIEKKNILEKGKQNSAELFECYGDQFTIYQNLNSKLQENEFTNIGEGLTLKTKIDFDTERFTNSFGGLFDLRTPLNSIFGDKFDANNTFCFKEDSHLDSIKSIYAKLPKRDEVTDIRLKSGTSNEDTYSKLFDDYFKINYTIEHKGDNILKMSLGKRGLVLLQLILHISNATHPILIDQPDDNLDNRTIYNELNQFVKEKKNIRQIILVTHNANLVVSTDAENVIVANQAGQQFGKDEREFRFEYISGPLENTFVDETQSGVLFQYGIREHVCDILEGGKEAFQKRERKYGFNK